ncbi:AbiH family protein [Acinetobacter terrestris]|uniref:AbiH family protein n=1 Tax=Acinetobacter terrestris TaxID=2529843 RepID=UPI001FD05A2F|nr:AbiH family protein [Acinetobacter terrestris]
MNILIVGNGFDLSHYLPTKYDHFMDVMAAIENKDLGKEVKNVLINPVQSPISLLNKILEIKKLINPNSYKMNFDNLFSECREKPFIIKTKEIYDTSTVQLSFEQIAKLQFKLQKNIWYQYFSHHVREIKTWIDFETKINDALKAVAIFIFQINKKAEEVGSFSDHICHVGECSRYQIFLKKEYCKILEQFKFLTSGYYQDVEENDEYDRHFTYPVETGDDVQGDLRFYINTKIIPTIQSIKK